MQVDTVMFLKGMSLVTNDELPMIGNNGSRMCLIHTLAKEVLENIQEY